MAVQLLATVMIPVSVAGTGLLLHALAAKPE